MQQIIGFVKNGYDAYGILVLNLSFVWIVLIYLYIEEKRRNNNLFYLSLFLMLLLINPFTASNLMSFWVPWDEYWKTFYMIPVVIVISYAGTRMVLNANKKVKVWMAAVGMIVVLLVSVNFMVSGKNISVLGNRFKIHKEVIEVADILAEVGVLKVIAPKEIAEQVREYTQGVKIFAGGPEEQAILGKIYADWSNIEDMDIYSGVYGCTCVVIPKKSAGKKAMKDTNYYLMDETENYYIYVFDFK